MYTLTALDMRRAVIVYTHLQVADTSLFLDPSLFCDCWHMYMYMYMWCTL